MKILPILAALLAVAPSGIRAADAPEAEPPAGSFLYTQAHHQVKVWYYVPPGLGANAPVVLVMPGAKRDGADYIEDWKPHARARHFLLVVPEYSQEQFPLDEGYIYGNTVDKAGKPVPRDEWSFSMIEPIFDAVRARTGNRSERYAIYGHSAGAQFVQRFLYFVPRARVSHAVAANAGWYTLPDLTVAFPYGLKGTPVTADDLRHALGLPLTILLGTADTNSKDRVLRHTPDADAQGAFRFARGKYFFARSAELARSQGSAFGWRLATAPGIGHSDPGMAPFALDALLEGSAP